MSVPSVRAMTAQDWPDVARIYAEGIATGHATFESRAPSWEELDADHLAAHRFVASGVDGVLGWAAVSPVSGRCVYAGVVEDSVYVARDRQGQGVAHEVLA